MRMVPRRIVVTNVASRSWASAIPRRGSGKHLYRWWLAHPPLRM